MGELWSGRARAIDPNARSHAEGRDRMRQTQPTYSTAISTPIYITKPTSLILVGSQSKQPSSLHVGESQRGEDARRADDGVRSVSDEQLEQKRKVTVDAVPIPPKAKGRLSPAFSPASP
ncbi:hypothetical protein CO652_05750 [Rhizobium sp. H4]|nr:hypothetical protein CO652_05750 [Rhizobium sp. H4]